jgi:hypothetical protein
VEEGKRGKADIGQAVSKAERQGRQGFIVVMVMKMKMK